MAKREKEQYAVLMTAIYFKDLSYLYDRVFLNLCGAFGNFVRTKDLCNSNEVYKYCIRGVDLLIGRTPEEALVSRPREIATKLGKAGYDIKVVSQLYKPGVFDIAYSRDY